ncbi:MAG: HAD family phosphatase [Pseudomonadota bacterium]
MNTEAVVFDIGNVLIEWQPERFFDRAIGADLRHAMFEAVDLHDMNLRVDLGENFTDVVYATAEAHPDWRREIRMWHDRWLEMAHPGIDHSIRLLHALRDQGVPVFALTNFGVETFAIARERYPFLNEFDRCYVSGHMQVIKPDPEIYRMVEDDCGLPPASLLFADDRPENIAAAKARGWQAHLFDGPDGWAQRLVDEGLLNKAAAA